MKILYTSGKLRETIYLDDAQYELLKDTRLYVSKENIICKYNGKTKSIASVLYPNLHRVVRVDATVHDYRLSNIRKETRESSVYRVNVRGREYFVGKVYKGGKHVVVPGYYKTKREALIIREAYILHHGIENVARNDLGLSDQEILKEYNKVLKQKEKQIKKTIKIRAKNQHTKAIQNRVSYGLYESKTTKGEDFYRIKVNNVEIGGSRDITVAKCVRNIYLADNKIKGDKLYDVGMSIEEQRQFVEDYKHKARLRILKGKNYRGICKQVRGKSAIYTVQLYSNGVRKFIGSSKDEMLAAMMYNIHKVKVGQAKEPINDVGLTLEEQLETLENNGYYMTEDFRFKKKRKK